VKLLDTLKEKYDLKNDAAISKALEVAPPVISRIRNGRMEPSADIILRIHEKLGMPVADIRACL
jgi:transcriptional regulator with XRE-family HTH domain